MILKLTNILKVSTIVLLALTFSQSIVNAQSPQKMSYQAVIRNSNKVLVANSMVGMRISILQGSETGMQVYEETQNIKTNANGLVSFEIGGQTGFDQINWQKGPYFIKTETDPTGGSDYTISGTSELLSVPFALMANTASRSLNDLDTSSVNELQKLKLSNDTLYLDRGGFVFLKNYNNATELLMLAHKYNIDSLYFEQRINDVADESKQNDLVQRQKIVDDSISLKGWIDMNTANSVIERYARIDADVALRTKQIADSTFLNNRINTKQDILSTGPGITLSGTTISHTAHTGDAIGATSLTVVAFQGRTISAIAPVSNDVLKWNGSAWAPAPDNSMSYADGVGIIISGSTISADITAPIWNANKLNGYSVSAAAPISNEILKWNGSAWIPAPEINTTYAAGTGITQSGTTFFHAAHTGDVTGTTSLTVAALQGKLISSVAPASNEILKWNGTAWTPSLDNNTMYAAGTGITLSSNTFNANNTSAIWNANQINGSSISTVAPTSNQLLKWNGTEWKPSNEITYSAGTGLILTGTTFSISGPIPVNLGGTGQTSYTDGQILIGNSTGTLTKSTITAGADISVTNGNGSITIANTNPNQVHTGDAIGSGSLSVVGIQGRSITTTMPSAGDVLSWDNSSSSWKPAQPTNMSTFNGNRLIKRPNWGGVSSTNVGTTTDVAAFLNAVFFPFISATISINGNVLYEIGTTNSVGISGATNANDETVFSNGRLDQTYPSIVTIYSFGSATSYSTSVTFSPNQSIASSLEYRYVAYQTVGNNGTPTTINSSVKYVQSCYPYLYGISSANLRTGGTTTYTALNGGKIIGTKSNRTVTFTGTAVYLYFCYPASYGVLTSILDQNSFEQITAFNRTTVNVVSSGLVNNWSEPYYIYQSDIVTSPAGWNYQFKY